MRSACARTLAANLIAQDAIQNKNALGYIPVAERCADSGFGDAVISRGFQETLKSGATHALALPRGTAVRQTEQRRPKQGFAAMKS